MLYGAIEKAVSGDGAVRRVARKVQPRVRLRKDVFMCALLTGLSAPLTLNTLGIGSGAGGEGKGLMLPGFFGYGNKRRRRESL